MTIEVWKYNPKCARPLSGSLPKRMANKSASTIPRSKHLAANKAGRERDRRIDASYTTRTLGKKAQGEKKGGNQTIASARICFLLLLLVGRTRIALKQRRRENFASRRAPLRRNPPRKSRDIPGSAGQKKKKPFFTGIYREVCASAGRGEGEKKGGGAHKIRRRKCTRLCSFVAYYSPRPPLGTILPHSPRVSVFFLSLFFITRPTTTTAAALDTRAHRPSPKNRERARSPFFFYLSLYTLARLFSTVLLGATLFRRYTCTYIYIGY